MTKQTQEALKMAIELLQIQIGELVLQKMRSGNDIPVSRCTITNSEIDALFNDIKKEALEQPAQEPVAWIDEEGIWEYEWESYSENKKPLYTHPAPSWQGLSDDMVRAIGEKCQEENGGILNWIDFYNAIESMLKDKNYE